MRRLPILIALCALGLFAGPAPARASWDEPHLSLWVGPFISESHAQSEVVLPPTSYQEYGFQGMAGLFSERWVVGFLARLGITATHEDFRLQEQELGPALMYRARRHFFILGMNLLGKLSVFRDNPDPPSSSSNRADTNVFQTPSGVSFTAGMELVQSIYLNLTVRNMRYRSRDDIWNKTSQYDNVSRVDQPDHLSGFSFSAGVSVLY